MRVFVAGATGVIGKPLVAALVGAGHEVSGLTRSEKRAEELAGQGATAAVGDVFDAAALGEIVSTARPEVVVHQLTALPPRIDPRKLARDVGPTNRIRTEGTDNLMAAARAAGARRFVAQSVAFAYAAGEADDCDEEAPLQEVDRPGLREIGAAIAHLEAAVTEAPLEGVVLRYGFFYGPRTVYAAPGGSMHEDVRRRKLPVVGRGRGRFAFLYLEDAVAATVRAVEGEAVGVFNVVEDESVPLATWLPVYAAAIGAKPPMRVPRWLGALIAGPYAAYLMDAMPGARNERFKAAFAWTPTRTWRDDPVLDHTALTPTR